MRYLFKGQLGVTRRAVHGREELLATQPGLVEPIGYLAPDSGRGRTNTAWRVAMHVALRLYDHFAGRRRRRYYSAEAFQMLAPGIDPRGPRLTLPSCSFRAAVPALSRPARAPCPAPGK